MKQKNKLLILASALIISANINSSFAQSTAATNTYNAANYLGWSSSNALPFKINGTQYMTLSAGGDLNINTAAKAYQINGNNMLWHNGNTADIFVGYNAGNSSMSGHYNTLIGNSAGNSITSGTWNTAIGYQAMKSNTVCMYNTAVGYQALYTQSTCPLCWDGTSAINVAVGYQALYNSSAYGGCALGYNAGFANTSGCTLVAVGESAAFSNTTGNYNVTVGGSACAFNQTGHGNTCMGDNTGKGVINNSHSYNSFFGSYSGYGITTGGNNVFMGYKAGYSNTSAANNLFIGYKAGYSNTTATGNSFMGYEAGYSNTTAANNAFVGYHAGYTNTTGAQNTFMGYQAGNANTTASYNAFFGYQAGNANQTGTQNAAFGNSALISQTTGDYNTAIGNYAMRLGSGVIRSTACGYTALYNTTSSGDYNTAIGYGAGSANTSGAYNTFIGSGAGALYTTGASNTFLGYGADANGNSYSNATALGNGAITDASNHIVIGNSSVTKIGGYQAWTNLSDGRFKTNVTEDVKGLEFINKLRPVTYNLDTKRLDDFITQNMPDSIKAKHKAGMDFTASTAIIHSGFIAQEVEQAEQQVGFSSSIVSVPSNDTEPYALSYAEIVVPLVKAVQELSKTADSTNTLAAQKDSINAVKMQELQDQIDQMTSIINSCCSSASAIRTGSNNNNSNNSINTNGSTPNATITNISLNNAQTIVLEQNVPNPFAEQTAINYSLPDNTGKAQMLFYNSDGKLIQSVELSQKGKGQLNVFASDLSSGIYTYTLVVDGKIVETKKMMKQ